ncbi:MAG: SAM-dependent methyltransferase [Methylocystaceae bacterium]|nr:MAG: SAM-dependent methyltransferase [Methylocystaceae bacterium]
MSIREDENLFTGPIGAEYRMLELICPNAALLARRVGERVGAWRSGEREPERLLGLEIGCGTGVSTLPLLAERDNLHLVAIDSSAKMLDQARANLAEWVTAGRVEFVEADALEHLRRQQDASVDVVVSNYAIHNFLDDYRREALAEVFRVLKPGGIFVNGDRYAVDDRAEHLALTQAEVRRWFEKFAAIGRYDLLEDWVAHLFSDESPEHIMYLTPALEHLKASGFSPVRVEYRDGVDTLLTAAKPA